MSIEPEPTNTDSITHDKRRRNTMASDESDDDLNEPASKRQNTNTRTSMEPERYTTTLHNPHATEANELPVQKGSSLNISKAIKKFSSQSYRWRNAFVDEYGGWLVYDHVLGIARCKYDACNTYFHYISSLM
jgi:hypothetical protein